MKLFASLTFALFLSPLAHAAEPVQIDQKSYLLLEGSFTNSCEQSSSSHAAACNDEKSEAAQACVKAGGHLPSLQEFSTLLRSLQVYGSGLVEERPFFQTGTIPSLTDAGVKKFEELFQLPPTGSEFWTSSLHVSMPDERPMTNAWALVVDHYRGQSSAAFTAGRTFTPHSVICVAN